MDNQPVCRNCLVAYEYKIGCGYSGQFQCPKCKHSIMVVWHDDEDIIRINIKGLDEK